MDIVERCDIHATKADDVGMYTTGDVLHLAAREIERLRRQVHEARSVWAILKNGGSA